METFGGVEVYLHYSSPRRSSNSYIFSEGLEGRDHVLDLNVEGMIILIWILHNMGEVCLIHFVFRRMNL